MAPYKFWGFPGGSEVKASASNARDLGSIPESGRSPGEGNLERGKHILPGPLLLVPVMPKKEEL